MSSSPNTPPNCTACTTPLPPPTPHLLIDSFPLCHPCLRHLFTLALHSGEGKASYPATWASHPLSAPRYAHILGPDLLSAYLAKGLEYGCPTRERVFCARTDPPRRLERCGNFVGRRWREEMKRPGLGGGVSAAAATPALCAKCDKCAWYTCLRCGETFSTSNVQGASAALSHECGDPSSPSHNAKLEEEEQQRAFAGLQRGRDWQVCPGAGCGRRVQLRDGCNSVRCVCRAHFCFVCGEVVRSGEGHWRVEGGCPRFGGRGDEGAIFDPPGGDGDGDADGGFLLGGEERVVGEEEGLRRAFEMQMRLVEEARRELEGAEEARRFGDRVEGGGHDGGAAEGHGHGQEEQRRLKRRRRRRLPHDVDVETSNAERRRGARSRRLEDDVVLGPVSEAPGQNRTRSRFRALLRDAVDVADYVLFGGSWKRRG